MDDRSSIKPFRQRMGDARAQPAFIRDDHWVWCPSVVRGPGSKWSLFASSWPKSLGFMSSYPLCSQVIRAEADRPEGPFTFRQVVLPDRGEGFWDGRATHNPQVHRIGDRYGLFYIGTTFEGDRPASREALPAGGDLIARAYGGFRIGCATADSPEGPWQRQDSPVLDVRPGMWDASITTNPAVCACRDGSLLMLYRSNTPDGCRLGVARAADLGEPFERVGDGPILADLHIEDPFVWQDPVTGRFEMIAKDLSGRSTGEFHAGVHAVSPDGIDWRLAPEPKAYSRRLKMSDGTSRTFGHLERPYILFCDGKMHTLYLATARPEGPFKQIEDRMHETWITAVGLDRSAIK